MCTRYTVHVHLAVYRSASLPYLPRRNHPRKDAPRYLFSLPRAPCLHLAPPPSTRFPPGQSTCLWLSCVFGFENVGKSYSSRIGKHKKDPTAKYCQLATAAVGGGASCRTWVFRGFWEDTGALKFITDRRSQKIPEISAEPGERRCWRYPSPGSRRS